MKSGGLSRSGTTKVLHFLVLATVITQLASSVFMAGPRPGRPGNSVFAVHQASGLAAFVILFAFWIWTVFRRNETRLACFIPWFSPARVLDVANDVQAHLDALRRGSLADHPSAPLACAVHGLGLLLASSMALTGAIWWSQLLPRGASGAVLEVHALLGNLMWAYLIGHAGVAIMHELLGHRVLARMFSWTWTRPEARPTKEEAQ